MKKGLAAAVLLMTFSFGVLPVEASESVPAAETATEETEHSFVLDEETFDYIRYADCYPDLYAVFGYDAEALLSHFLNYGSYEGREFHSTDELTEAVLATGDIAARNFILYVSRQAYEEAQLTDEMKADLFYENAMFIGDSILVGFRDYVAANPDLPLADAEIYARISYSITNSFIRGADHPEYHGEEMQPWEAAALEQPDRILIELGVNDLGYNTETIVTRYQNLVDKLLEVVPDAKIYVISVPPVYRGRDCYTNENVDALNARLRPLAAQKGWGFIEINDLLSDREGALKSEYCSDNYLHENRRAYVVWANALIDYAVDHYE